jgi:hypothetical protein
MFAKVFTQILDSSLAEDYQTRHVFEDLLKLCDINGVVDMTHEAIARRTNVPLKIVQRGIAELEKSDPRSRNPDNDGRRIVRLDKHRDWGWKIVNYAKYREIRTQAEKSKAHGYDTSRRGYIYYAVDDPDQPKEIKIGFSANPWARILELRTARPKIKILVTENGTLLDESSRHERFQTYHISGEWYRFDGEIKNYVELLLDKPLRSDSRSYDRSDESDRSPMQRDKQMERDEDEREKAFPEIPPMSRKDFDALVELRGIPKDCAEWFWNTHDARNWLDAKGQPILKVEPLLLNALVSWRARERPAPAKQQGQSLSTAELILRQKEYERVLTEILTVKRNAARDAMGTMHYTEKERQRVKELCLRRDELRKLLNLKV